MVESLLFIGAGAGEKNTQSRSKTDQLRNTDRMYLLTVLASCLDLDQEAAHSRPVLLWA